MSLRRASTTADMSTPGSLICSSIRVTSLNGLMSCVMAWLLLESGSGIVSVGFARRGHDQGFAVDHYLAGDGADRGHRYAPRFGDDFLDGHRRMHRVARPHRRLEAQVLAEVHRAGP